MASNVIWEPGAPTPYHDYMNRSTLSATVLELTGDGLTLDDAERILHGAGRAPDPGPRRPQARREGPPRSRIARWPTAPPSTASTPASASLSNQRIEPDEVLALQENLLRSHAVGMGPLLSIGVSRLALALRIQALAKGYSGVTVELIEALIEMYNRGVVPAIPEQGSVGASGDLAPLAHLALVVMGEGHAFVTKPGGDATPPAAEHRKPLSGRAALRRVHLKPYRPQAKEGLSLINGTQISTAILADALVRARHLARRSPTWPAP